MILFTCVLSLIKSYARPSAAYISGIPKLFIVPTMTRSFLLENYFPIQSQVTTSWQTLFTFVCKWKFQITCSFLLYFKSFLSFGHTMTLSKLRKYTIRHNKIRNQEGSLEWRFLFLNVKIQNLMLIGYKNLWKWTVV